MDQLVECLLVQMASLALVNDRSVRLQAACSQLLQDDLIGSVDAAWRVDIFYPHQPLAIVCFGIEPAG
jgi:hypothetical protein